MKGCCHERTRKPASPVPDWTGLCPDCGERVKYDRGWLVTVREVNKRIAQQVHLTLDPEDAEVLREALWHAVQRGDVPGDERRRMHSLRAALTTTRRGDAA